MKRLRNFAGGEYVDAKHGRTSQMIDPSTGGAYAARRLQAFRLRRGPVMHGFEDYTRVKHVMRYIGT